MEQVGSTSSATSRLYSRNTSGAASIATAVSATISVAAVVTITLVARSSAPRLVAHVRREQRDQRRGEHAAEQEVVDDVRRLVGEQVGVAERVEPDDGGEHEHPEQAGDAREQRARRDDDVGTQEAVGV
jgi:hypothetical protein